jgi:hypothetical protein
MDAACHAHRRYEKKDLVLNAVFDNTLSSSGNGSQLQADHSKLDNYSLEDVDQLSRMSRRQGGPGRIAPRLSVPTFGTLENGIHRLSAKLKRRISGLSDDYGEAASKVMSALEQRQAGTQVV